MDKNFKQVPEKQYRSDVRWWLAEGLHTDQTLKNEMQQLDDMGMGAIEFLAMTDPSIAFPKWQALSSLSLTGQSPPCGISSGTRQASR